MPNTVIPQLRRYLTISVSATQLIDTLYAGMNYEKGLPQFSFAAALFLLFQQIPGELKKRLHYSTNLIVLIVHSGPPQQSFFPSPA